MTKPPIDPVTYSYKVDRNAHLTKAALIAGIWALANTIIIVAVILSSMGLWLTIIAGLIFFFSAIVAIIGGGEEVANAVDANTRYKKRLNQAMWNEQQKQQQELHDLLNPSEPTPEPEVLELEVHEKSAGGIVATMDQLPMNQPVDLYEKWLKQREEYFQERQRFIEEKRRRRGY